jgi:hypothetical protein
VQSTGRYFYAAPSHVRLDINDPYGSAAPLVYLENRALELSELGISVLREPVLSAAAIGGWKDKGAVVTRDTLDTCVVAYGTSADSSWTYKIDKTRWLITGLTVHQVSPDSNVFNGLFFYRDSSDIPVLEKIALMKDTSMQHGGYVFSNIKINQPLPDSMFTIGVIHVRCVIEKGKLGIIVNSSSVLFEFPREAGIMHAAVYDAAGRKIKMLSVDGNSGQCVWRFGNSIQAGFYFLRAEGKRLTFGERFLIAR